MANVLDVAESILQLSGDSDTMRLQKLVYYAQACHLARHGETLFDEPIKAWVNGPVVPILWNAHKKRYYVSTVDGDVRRLTPSQRESVETAINIYGGHDAAWLINQTHSEPPWVNARGSLSPGDSTESPLISTQDMQDYYGKILDFDEIDNLLSEESLKDALTLTADEIRARYAPK